MIVDTLTNSDRYQTLQPGFAEAFAFLRRPGLRDLAVGRYEIDGDRVFAIVARDPGRRQEDAQLEIHEKYIDIQLVLDGNDDMGWRPKSLCRLPAGDYDPEDDIRFYADSPTGRQQISPDMFAVFFPEDAHQPLVGEGVIHKVVVKVAVDRR
jgi:YhcH/YjgK/YiaL family protein